MQAMLALILKQLMGDIAGKVPGILGNLVGSGQIKPGEVVSGVYEGLKAANFSNREIIQIIMHRHAGMPAADLQAELRSMDPGGAVVDPPPTDPDPGPGDPPTVPYAPVDAVILGSIKWMEGGDFASWPITHDLHMRKEGAVFRFDPGPPWTKTCNVSGKQLAGNFWIGIWDDGHKSGRCAPTSGSIRGRTGAPSTCPGTRAISVPHMSRGPNPGEEVLYMISGAARVGMRTVRERSNIIKFTW
jgi:hypothetical protein